MPQLHLYPLPYTLPQPPAQLFRNIDTESGPSDTVAFNRNLDDRDVFLGERRCVICGQSSSRTLQHCHIVGRLDDAAWSMLKRLEWVPATAKGSPEHESRNGLTMCSNHHLEFDNWEFFIRFQPETGKYIFVHYDSYRTSRALEPFHGKAVALDFKDNRAPLPLLLLVHEYMVRGRNFYQPTPDVEVASGWQDWIINDGVVSEGDNGSFAFKRSAPTTGPPASQSTNLPAPRTAAPPSGSRTYIMPPTADLVAQLMAAQRTLPSWKSAQMESMSWDGTAEENIKKYAENVGVESTG
ncbi:hypothetical protein BJV74DRAFT_779408 [Russula compacta]|nr:hypothetical protein BJV74DRAFT_779408 [Russula compacta]